MSERYEAEGPSVWDHERQRFICYTLPAQDAESKRLAERIAAALNQQAQAYNIDEDELGIRKLVADAITGAIAFGINDENPPPEGHWLTPFWQFGSAAAPQPQASAEDVALVNAWAIQGADPEGYEAWQRIRADYERMGVK